MMTRAQAVKFLDIAVHPTTVTSLTELVAEGISTKQKWLIANHNLHSLYLYHKEVSGHDKSLLKDYFKRAECTHIDGMSIVALARMYGHDVRREHRTGYTDWIPSLMSTAVEQQWKVFYLGSAPGVAERGANILCQRYPGLNLKVRNGFFNTDVGSSENKAVLANIADFRPNLLMVGMGMPRQERWIEANFERIDANVFLASGAALDYVAGAIPTPPRWMGRVGLEWAFRLASEPKRLSSRYLVEPWSVLKWVLQDAMGRRDYNPTWVQGSEVDSHGRPCTYLS
jgi:N-acetylglucosaminyldiphosphoundecaprenol N-acetyl-beta-D-mannosaminyltransferase